MFLTYSEPCHVLEVEGKELFIRQLPELNDELAPQLVENCTTVAEVFILSLFFKLDAIYDRMLLCLKAVEIHTIELSCIF